MAEDEQRHVAVDDELLVEQAKLHVVEHAVPLRVRQALDTAVQDDGREVAEAGRADGVDAPLRLEFRHAGALELVVAEDRLEDPQQRREEALGVSVFVVKPAVDNVADEERLLGKVVDDGVNGTLEDRRASPYVRPSGCGPTSPTWVSARMAMRRATVGQFVREVTTRPRDRSGPPRRSAAASGVAMTHGALSALRAAQPGR